MNIPIAPNNTSAYETTRSVAPQATATLASMELDTFVCSSGDTYSQTLHWTSADTDIATVNSSTGAVTGVSYGVTTITGTKIISGTTYSVSYKMVVSALPVSGYELEYEPEKWNPRPELYDDDYRTTIKANTNCYLYAFNIQLEPNGNTNTISSRSRNPGEYADNTKQYQDILVQLCKDNNVVEFISYVQRDAQKLGFEIQSIGRIDVCPVGHYKVALAFGGANGYHWYRQNSDGIWSHKFGIGAPVYNVDSTYTAIIQDPTSAAKTYDGGSLVYQIVGYYSVTPVNWMYELTEEELELIED